MTEKQLNAYFKDKWDRTPFARLPKDLSSLVKQFDAAQDFLVGVGRAVARFARSGGPLSIEESTCIANLIAEHLQLEMDSRWYASEKMAILYDCETFQQFVDAFWSTEIIPPVAAAAKYFSLVAPELMPNALRKRLPKETAWDLMSKLPRFLFEPLFNHIFLVAEWPYCVRTLEIVFPTYSKRVKDWWKPLEDSMPVHEIQDLLLAIGLAHRPRPIPGGSPTVQPEGSHSPVAAEVFKADALSKNGNPRRFKSKKKNKKLNGLGNSPQSLEPPRDIKCPKCQQWGHIVSQCPKNL